MGLCNSPDIFQENMSELFVGLDIVRVYIDELLHVTKGSWTEHLYILEEIFTRFQKAGLKVDARKSCFGAHKFDYLSYHITCDGVMPIPKKVEAIQALAVPKIRKQLRGHTWPRTHVTVEVNNSDKLTQLFASFWNCEGLNCLDFLRYGHNPLTSDVIT